MSELIKNLGIEWHILIAQLVNFAILFFVLKKFVYKPVITALKERRATLEGNERQTKDLAEKLQEIERQKDTILSQARKDSELILERAKISAKETSLKRYEEAREESARIISDGQKKLTAEKEKMIAEAKSEIGSLVVLSLQKILGAGVDPKIHETLAEEALKIMREANANK
ncbi:MAG: ATP synthase subunit b [Parcubacteria group bacterium GW2011_GWB1_44_7]|nr:MAG: ATP synthase subunit b [Parcubacteria group bacterium GW2011_GWB1_44_7]